MSETTTYAVRVPIFKTFPSGTMKSTGVRVIEVTEEATILGSCRAIDKAIEQVNERRYSGYLEGSSPEITPNPAEEGWPLGN